MRVCYQCGSDDLFFGEDDFNIGWTPYICNSCNFRGSKSYKAYRGGVMNPDSNSKRKSTNSITHLVKIVAKEVLDDEMNKGNRKYYDEKLGEDYEAV